MWTFTEAFDFSDLDVASLEMYEEYPLLKIDTINHQALDSVAETEEFYPGWKYKADYLYLYFDNTAGNSASRFNDAFVNILWFCSKK